MKSRSRFTKLISVIAVMLVAVFMLSACNGKDEDKVKLVDFTAYTQSDIVDWSLANKVQDKINYLFERSETVPENYFIRASLEVGSVIDKEFDVVISLGNEAYSGSSFYDEIFMPNVIGMTVNEATEAIRDAGILSDIEILEMLYDLPEGTVMQSRPNPNSYLGFKPESTKDTVITLIVARGIVINKLLTVTLDLPHPLSSVMKLKVYVNNVLYTTFDTDDFKDPKATAFDFTVSGNGTADVTVEEIFQIGDKSFAVYQTYHFIVDFDNGTYRETSEPFNPYKP